MYNKIKKVGIIASFKEEEFDKINRVAFDYIKPLEKIEGVIPFIIPCNTKNIDFYINEFDYFIIPGGDDIDPKLYGQEVDGSKNFYTENDKINLLFIEKIINSGKRLLGICRGMQLINIYFGGDLIQDIKHKNIHYNYENQYSVIHNIKIEKNTYLREIFNKEILGVNSIHHQAINKLGKNLIISAYDEKNNYVEAIETKNKKILGVQWHPENLENHLILLKKFINN